uniref:hypothetical protein n=1 Tax=Streptomyces sp. NPDC058385 TaxID=3346473 RepID=UPI0036551554
MTAPDRIDERLRALGLVEGQRTAQALFAEVAARGLTPPDETDALITSGVDGPGR